MSTGSSAAEDPRVTRSKAAVVDATLELIAERGVSATTVEEISDRSGVAKTTIYRHWAGKPAVVLDVISSRLEPPRDPDTGDLRRDLHILVEGLTEGLTSSPLAPLLPSLIDAAERDPELARLHRRFTEQRHEVVRQVLQRGVERGELSPRVSLDLALDLLAGPVFYRRLMGAGTVDRAFGRSVVDVVLRGLTPT